MLIPLWEVDAVRSLCAGVVYASQQPEQISVAVGRGELAGWRESVPANALSAIERAREYGQAVILEVDARIGGMKASGKRAQPTALPSPVSISRVKRLLCRNENQRAVLLARLRAFPDVPLDIVPFEVLPGAFQSEGSGHFPLEETIRPVGDAQDRNDLARLQDKALGAAACLLHGMKGSAWDQATLQILSSAFEGPVVLASNLIAGVTSALHQGAPDPVGAAFSAALADRLSVLRPKEGFDPEALLKEVIAASLPAVDEDGASVLRQFESAAVSVLDGTSNEGRRLLEDGGSLGLRAGLLVLRVVGSIDQLEAMARRSGGVGKRVLALSWALLGSQIGCAALPNAIKAQPLELLRSLGDMAEAARAGAREWIQFDVVRSKSGRLSWTVKLAGREVASLADSSQEKCEPVLALAERRSWEAVQGDAELSYAVLDVAGSKRVVSLGIVECGPVVPFRMMLRVSARAADRPSRSLPQAKQIQKLLDGAATSGVALEIAKGPRGWTAEYALYGDGLPNIDKVVDEALVAIAAAFARQAAVAAETA